MRILMLTRFPILIAFVFLDPVSPDRCDGCVHDFAEVMRICVVKLHFGGFLQPKQVVNNFCSVSEIALQDLA